MSIEKATSLLQELKAKFEGGDIIGGKEIFSNLKIVLLEFPYESPCHTKIAAEILEIGILMMVEDGDIDSFTRNVTQIKPLYDALGKAGTSRKCHILGLNLMNLLVDNRLSEFHAELELLTEEESRNTYVTFPIKLERQLMVGIYDEVLNTTVPDPSYQFFIDSLLQTVRDSIADCVEVSYKTMTISDAMTMMKFGARQDLIEYIEECRDDWIFDADTLWFQAPPSGSKVGDIPSMKLIAQNLSYATEMERIV